MEGFAHALTQVGVLFSFFFVLGDFPHPVLCDRALSMQHFFSCLVMVVAGDPVADLSTFTFVNICLLQLPTTIADNAGYDSSKLVSELKAEHAKGNQFAGLDMDKGCVGNVQELGITESYKVKNQVLMSASEAAEMILRVDDILKAAPRQRTR